MSKELNDKAIDIKGKKYVLVSDRVLYFNETYPQGSITTELISTPDAETVIIKATIFPDSGLDRVFTVYSLATWNDGMVNKTAALENAETSAVGRALAFMGIGVIESIASADEVKKAVTQSAWKSAPKWEPKHRDVAKESAEEDAGTNSLPNLNG
jgi:hypothetical protein